MCTKFPWKTFRTKSDIIFQNFFLAIAVERVRAFQSMNSINIVNDGKYIFIFILVFLTSLIITLPVFVFSNVSTSGSEFVCRIKWTTFDVNQCQSLLSNISTFDCDWSNNTLSICQDLDFSRYFVQFLGKFSVDPNRRKCRFYSQLTLINLLVKSQILVHWNKNVDAVFSDGWEFSIKFDPINYFFNRRVSYHFKAREFDYIRVFQLLNKNILREVWKFVFYWFLIGHL